MPLTIVLTLSAGIGAVVAVFAITWAVLWRPFDAPSPDRLVWIAAQAKEEAGPSSPGAFAAWETTARTLTAAIIGGAEWWAPLILDAKDRANTGPRYLDVIGRLGPSASLDTARDELRAIGARLP